MFSMRKILVGVEVGGEPLEFTPPTQEAIHRALWLAGRNQATVTLMSVLSTPPVDSEALMESDDNPLGPLEQTQKLHADVSKHALEQGVKVQSRIEHGKPWTALVKEVTAGDHDLLIIGTRNRSSIQRGLFGSTGVKLLGKCPCPVWVAQPNDFSRDPTTIVAADDLGPVGEKVLHVAVSMAQLTNSRLLVVHAIKEAAGNSANGDSKAVQEEAESKVIDRLSHTDYRTIDAGTKIEIGIGSAESILKNAVKDHNAALLIMGTLERGGLAGIFVGNTAERLLPELTCSVLGVKPDEFKSPINPE